MSDDELSAEFKNAANSMTRLFKLARESKQSVTVAREEGYQMALYDLILAMEANPQMDAKLWAQQILLGTHSMNNTAVVNHREREGERQSDNESIEGGSRNQENHQNHNQASPLLLQSLDDSYRAGEKRRVLEGHLAGNEPGKRPRP